MSFEQLELLLYDMYQMDAWFPPPIFKFKTYFKNVSYSQWAIEEFKKYIADNVNFSCETSYIDLDEIIEKTKDFMQLLNQLSEVNLKTKQMFMVAWNVADDILDLLHSMK